MASIKKYNGSSFENAAIRKYSIATDTITTLPSDLYADGNSATVGLVGNMSQTGTPTPTSPIQPQECGERTGNLFDKDGAHTTSVNYYYEISGLDTTKQYTCSTSLERIEGALAACVYFSQTTNISSTTNGVWKNEPKTFTPNENGTLYVAVRAQEASGAPAIADDVIAGTITIMVNEGSTPLPYEPYGYKIPILSANTTTPVYLGEVESTRKIKKLVLTGEETYTSDPSYSRFITVFPNAKIEGLRLTPVYCTHFISVYDGRPVSEVPNNSIYSSDRLENKFFIKTTDYTTDTEFKAYLAQQYANGTPVTVWYALATPQTAVVNEPLRKIGDYADTISGITIPTITGKDSFDVQTTLKPSEVSLSYTGWHDATVKEWDGSEWQ